jgi:hypothetical protein
MTSKLKIYIDRLKDGHEEKIDETLSSDVLDVREEELAFSGQLSVSGKAYLADDHLILNLKIKSLALIPCAICNQTVEVPIVLDSFYLPKPMDELLSTIFDFTNEIREAVLLHVPAFTECSNGKCPERETIKNFLKKPDVKSKIEPKANYPFADL